MTKFTYLTGAASYNANCDVLEVAVSDGQNVAKLELDFNFDSMNGTTGILLARGQFDPSVPGPEIIRRVLNLLHVSTLPTDEIPLVDAALRINEGYQF